MKKIDLIYKFLVENSGESFTASFIAEKLKMLRSNVSRELNKMCRDGKIFKSSGRPVLYSLNEIQNKIDANNKEEITHVKEKDIRGKENILIHTPLDTEKENAFSELIGSGGSLKKQVQQAKAAIIYPPNGLHTLIVGQTGVGKTLIVHMMYNYGKEMGVFSPNAPFITFNCADYYNNPQLLMSQIFGYIKGAFTGAEKDTPGLIEMADNGILFLDEIHRLPPEGQEMIFYFMDMGTFSRLGERKRARSAKVLIIGATTENPESVLTKTFQRRIPNIIKIPPLEKRTIKEKLDIIKVLFSDEANAIKKPIKVTVDAVKALLGSINSGNIGQLKSNIRFLCAHAFLNSLQDANHIEVSFEMMPANIKSGILNVSKTREDLDLIDHYLTKDFYLSPLNKISINKEENIDPFNLYQMVTSKLAILKNEGIEDKIIKQILVADINSYVKTFYNQTNEVSLSVYDRLLKIIDLDMVSFAKEIVEIVAKKIDLLSEERLLYAFALHLSSLLNRVQNGTKSTNLLSNTINENSVEYKLAQKIKLLVEAKYKIAIDKEEAHYFAMLLQSMKKEIAENKIVIVVAMHGEYTASSMVNVVKSLFPSSKAPLLAFDMPLSCPPDELVNKIIKQLQSINCQSGILLMADMGSICSMGSILAERLNVDVKTIGMVSTPFVLEAVRKLDISDMSLEGVYNSLISFYGYEYGEEKKVEEDKEEKVILTICSTGFGTAEKLGSMLEDILKENDLNYKIIPLSVVDMDKEIDNLLKSKKILAAIGIKKPKENIPFIPIEEFFASKDSLMDILKPKNNIIRDTLSDEDRLKKLATDGLDEMLLFLNPKKIIKLILDYIHHLEKSFAEKWQLPQKLQLAIHIGCALERVIKNDTLQYMEEKSGVLPPEKLALLHSFNHIFKDAINISLTEDEEKYILAIILHQLHK